MSQQATEAEILADRQKRTAALRAEFWKQVTNPYRHATGEGGHIFDPAVQRYISTRSSQYDYFKGNWVTGKWALGLAVIPCVFFYVLLKKERDTKEHLYRTGQVAYKDRKFKFI